MTESSKWMVLVTVLVVGVAIGAVVYDTNFRTKHFVLEEGAIININGDRVQYCNRMGQCFTQMTKFHKVN